MIRSDTLFRIGVVALLVASVAWLRSEPQSAINAAPVHVSSDSLVGRTFQHQSAPDAALKTPDTIGGGLGNRYVNDFMVKRAGAADAVKPAQ